MSGHETGIGTVLAKTLAIVMDCSQLATKDFATEWSTKKTQD